MVSTYKMWPLEMEFRKVCLHLEMICMSTTAVTMTPLRTSRLHGSEEEGHRFTSAAYSVARHLD